MQTREDKQPGLEAKPGSASRTAPASGKRWKTPAIAGGAAFVAVRLLRLGLAGKVVRTAFKLGRGPAGKLALSLAAKKMASRKRK